MPFRRNQVVLAVGAHPDDVELGCGGSIALATHAGAEVHAVTFSECKDETSKADNTLRAREAVRAASVIGAEPHVLDIPNRGFPEHRDRIMQELERFQKELQPALVLTPFLEDPHQDHSTLAYATVRTFRRNETILQYEILRYGSHTFTPNVFVDITETLEQKLQALKKYRSQFGRRAYFDTESFRSLARTRGAQSGLRYAEGFVAYKIYW